MWMTDEPHVRTVIHDFNERGMASLDPDYRGGRPRRITEPDRRRVVAVAGARPDTQGIALTRWSLPRLADHLTEQGIAVSPAHLGRLLADAGLSFQRTRTWKASPDPDYEAKAARVLELTASPPSDGGAVSRLIRWARSACARCPVLAGRHADAPSASVRPITAAMEPARPRCTSLLAAHQRPVEHCDRARCRGHVP